VIGVKNLPKRNPPNLGGAFGNDEARRKGLRAKSKRNRAAASTPPFGPTSIVMKNVNVTGCVVLVVLLSASAASAQPGPRKYPLTTSCVTEIRGGKKSCWGIIVNCDDALFKKRIKRSQLKIFESKHGANLLNLMTWHTSRDRKQLTIRFKPGTGDFGTGNQAQITLYKTAFRLPPKNFPEYMVMVQRTDSN
jgi:hypothetical protein